MVQRSDQVIMHGCGSGPAPRRPAGHISGRSVFHLASSAMAEQNLQQSANGRQGRLGIYEEVTLSPNKEEDGYARLSELKILDKYSYSEEFDDPSSLLDRHPFPEGMEFYPG